MKYSAFFLLAIFSLVMLSSCEKDNNNPSTETQVAFQFDYNVNGQDFAYNTVYDVGGTNVSFEFAQFYIHGITLRPEEGNDVVMEDKYLLVKPDRQEYDLNTVEKGHYHMVMFNVGVSAEDNDQTEEDFTQRAADDPLALQTPEPMHWNWNAGYIFFKINAQTDADGDGTPETRMEYHIGTNNMLRGISLMAHKELEQDNEVFTFALDLAKLFKGIDLSTDYSCHTGDHPELAVAFSDNLQDAFSMK